MKKALLLAAMTLVSASAFASKARVTALTAGGLGNYYTQATDVQDVWMNPAEMFLFGDLVTYEYGTAVATNTIAGTFTSGAIGKYENAAIPEGGIFRSMGDSKWGFYVGHKNTALELTKNVSGFTPSNTLQQNPFTVFYGSKAGDMSWALNLTYFSSKQDTGAAFTPANTGMGIGLGAVSSAWKAYFNMGLSSKEDASATNSFVGKSSFRLGGEYWMGDSVAYLDYQSVTGANQVTGSTDINGSWNVIAAGYETKVKSDVASVFYGVKYQTVTLKNDTATVANQRKIDMAQLPVYIGIEGEAASWLTLRGSVALPVLIDTVKLNNGTTSDTTLTSVTPVTPALGAAFKWGKMVADWTVSQGTTNTAGTGKLGTDGFGTNASLTYNF